MKNKAMSRLQVENEGVELDEYVKAQDDLTPQCMACGQENIGLLDEAFIMIRGMWMQSTEYEVPVFIPDPDTKYRIVKLPNNQLGIFVDYQGPTLHAHKECVEHLLSEELDEEYDDDDEDED